jgi:hypothetical protein
VERTPIYPSFICPSRLCICLVLHRLVVSALPHASCLTSSCLVLCRPILFCLISSHPVPSHHVMSCPILTCLVLSHLVSSHHISSKPVAVAPPPPLPLPLHLTPSGILDSLASLQSSSLHSAPKTIFVFLYSSACILAVK